MRRNNPVRFAALRNLLIIVTLLTVITVAFLPATAFATVGATSSTGDGGGPLCLTVSSTDSTQVDASTCLPSGRWGSLVGSTTYRTEPSDGVVGFIANMPAMISHTTRSILPNMLMMITQVCWSSALAISQFAASFEPMDAAGAAIDSAAGDLINGAVEGGLLSAFMVVGIVAFCMAVVFNAMGGAKAVGKRIGAMILCLAALVVLGSGAARTEEGATTPATGSPWWVVKTINDTINTVAVSINLDGINDSNPSMMAYDNPSGSEQTCQDYLYAMHADYDSLGESDTSNVTSTVNRLWEETALRSWVTMQWGNPQANGSTTEKVAQNARMAYCHVLDMKAGTDADVQAHLTNAELGTAIDSQTAAWIFSEDGWIGTYHSLVDDGKWTDDRDSNVMQTRAGVFWETCTSDGSGKDGIYARNGWGVLINNLGDQDSGEIENAGKRVRAALKGDSIKDAEPTNPDLLLHAAANEDSTTDAQRVEATGVVCTNVLDSVTQKNTNGLFHRTKGDGYGRDRSKTGEDGQQDTNLGDAAILGWRFDVPNTGGTWNEANLQSLNDPNTDTGAVKATLDYLYGNTDPDTLGAFGSVIGGICNLVVWGLLSLVLILSKLMLCMMGLFLVAAVIVRAWPIGETPKRALTNWVKYTANLSMTGILYSTLATIATFICNITLRFCSSMSSGFLYNIISGLSPVLAIAVIGMFCSKVLNIGNPFSLNAFMGIAGGGLLLSGASRLIASGVRSAISGRMFARSAFGRRGRHKGGERYSTRGRGQLGNANESGRVLDDAVDGQNDIPPKDPLSTWGDKASQRWSDLADGIEKRKDPERWMTDAQSLMDKGISEGDAVRIADRHETLRSISPKDAIQGIGAGIATVGGLAYAAARSPLARDAIGRTAKVAATAGAAALAFSNPVTAPLGLLAAGKLATNRDVWHGAAAGLRAVGTAAPGAVKSVAHGAANAMRVGRGTLYEKAPGLEQKVADIRTNAAGVAATASNAAAHTTVGHAATRVGVAARGAADTIKQTWNQPAYSTAKAAWENSHVAQTLNAGMPTFVNPQTGDAALNPFERMVVGDNDAATAQMPVVNADDTPTASFEQVTAENPFQSAPTDATPPAEPAQPYAGYAVPDGVSREAFATVMDNKRAELDSHPQLSEEYKQKALDDYAKGAAIDSARNYQGSQEL